MRDNTDNERRKELDTQYWQDRIREVRMDYARAFRRNPKGKDVQSIKRYLDWLGTHAIAASVKIYPSAPDQL